MDRFRLMQTFVQVAHTGSFTTVGSQVGLSRAVISRHISELEEHLGVRLFNRSTRALVLTDAGRTYLTTCENIFEELTKQEAQLVDTQKELKGTLNVVAPKSLGGMQLGDAFVSFSNLHPGINLRVMLDDFTFRTQDFISKGLDVAIRGGADIPDTAVISQKLGELNWVVCASPSYLKKQGAPTQPSELSNHNCLAHINLDYSDRIWRFRGPTSELSVKIDGDFFSNSALVLRKAVLAGRGIGFLPLYCTYEDLAAGRLKRILPKYQIPKRSFFALYPYKRMLPSRTRVFINFLKDWFKDFDKAERRHFAALQ